MRQRKINLRQVLIISFLLGSGLVFPLTSCKSDKKDKKDDVTRAFYYWQTSLWDFDFRDSTFLSLKVPKLYVRLFDVDWDDQHKRPVPVAPLELDYKPWTDSTLIVPVIFITNETFQQLNEAQSRDLAHLVHKKIMSRISRLNAYDWYMNGEKGWWEQNPYQLKTKNFREQERRDSAFQQQLKLFPEIQFDCDWTASTKTKYFAFLNEYKSLFPGKTISATVRLYQYKYPDKAGIPPVQRGMLMCYNAGNIRKAETKNSLFDKKEVMSYLEEVEDYPLPLDYALPVFNWGVMFSKGKFKSILSLKELGSYSQNLSIKDSLYYQDSRPGGVVTVTEDFVLGDSYNSPYLRKGDQIRIEKASMKDVLEVAKFLSERRESGTTLSLFHLNENDLTQHAKEINLVFDTF